MLLSFNYIICLCLRWHYFYFHFLLPAFASLKSIREYTNGTTLAQGTGTVNARCTQSPESFSASGLQRSLITGFSLHSFFTRARSVCVCGARKTPSFEYVQFQIAVCWWLAKISLVFPLYFPFLHCGDSVNLSQFPTARICDTRINCFGRNSGAPTELHSNEMFFSHLCSLHASMSYSFLINYFNTVGNLLIIIFSVFFALHRAVETHTPHVSCFTSHRPTDIHQLEIRC